MDKALNYLALARKGSMAELGEEPVGAVSRLGKARLVMVASDASDHTWRRARDYVAGTDQQCIRVPFTKEEMGYAVGRTSLAIAAITDAALALALVKALPDAQKHQAAATVLEDKARRIAQRAKEAKAHQRNLRKGKKK